MFTITITITETPSGIVCDSKGTAGPKESPTTKQEHDAALLFRACIRAGLSKVDSIEIPASLADELKQEKQSDEHVAPIQRN